MQFEGYNALYIPGWDCHGLPIEWQIEKNIKKGVKKDEVDIREFRKDCRDFALKWISTKKSLLDFLF